MRDSFGRTINYMRISLTDLCNLRCRYCVPEQGVEKKRHSDILRFEEIADIVRAGAKLGVTKVRLTGGEPLVRRGVVSLAAQVCAVQGIREVTLTTNATLLPQFAQPLADAGLCRVNISLDTLDAAKYANITRGGDITQALAGIQAAKAAGLLPIKINVVLMRGFNDDEIESFVRMTADEEVEVRFIELMPIGGCAQEFTHGRQMPVSEVLSRFPELMRASETDSHVSVNYALPGAKGRIGLISPVNHMFCDRCNRLRITADGKIKPCLHSDEEFDIRAMRAAGQSYEQILVTAAGEKPYAHRLGDAQFIERCMNSIGG